MLKSDNQDSDILAGHYEGYRQTRVELMTLYSRKVRNSIFVIAILFFLSDFLSLAIANTVSGQMVLYCLIVPVMLVGVGLLALSQPLTAIVITLLVFAGLIVYVAILYGSISLIKGALVKILILYFLIKGFQYARMYKEMKKELG